MLVIEKKAALPSKKTLLLTVLVLVVFYIVWYLIANSYSQNILIQEAEENSQPAPTVEIVAEVIEESPVSEPSVVAPTKSDVTTKIENKNNAIKEISDEVYTAPIAFVATERVWVAIRDLQKNRVILDKVMAKNEHYIPKIPLEDIAVSTARGGVLDLYINGIRTNTLKKEDNLPLIGLTKG